MIAGSSSILVKCLWNKSCLWAVLLKFWFPADFGRENSTGFYMFLTFLSIVTRWSRSTSNFYALIGQNLTGEFMLKIYAAPGNMFTDSWSRQTFVSSCDVFFFYWMYEMKSSCYQDSSVFHGGFAYCAFVWEMHRLSLESLEIRVWMASFSKMSLLTCPCSRRKTKEVWKSQAILASLDGLQEQHLDW